MADVKYLENELNQFNSYSYHHVLAVANSTVVADLLQNSESAHTRLISQSQPFRYGQPMEAHTVPGAEDKGKYVVLLNSTKQSDFYIDEVSWSSIFLPKTEGLSPNIQAVEGTLRIVEPKTARFFAHLQRAIDTLDTDPVGMIFVLKTFFVGQRTGNDQQGVQSGSQEIIANVKPFTFAVYDIINEFEATGSSYTLSCLGVVGGVSKLPIFSRIPQIQGITDGNRTTLAAVEETPNLKNPSLNDVLLDFENRWNMRSFENFKQVEQQVAADQKKKFKHRMATMEVTLDWYYRQLGPNGLPLNNEFAVDMTSEKSKIGPNVRGVAIDMNSTVEESLAEIMRSCKRVNEEAEIGVEDPVTKQKRYYTFRITCVLQSTAPTEKEIETQRAVYEEFVKSNKKPSRNDFLTNNLTFTGRFHAHYYITRVEITKNRQRSFIVTDTATETDDYLLKLSYFFTGKNVDIKDMQLKMDMGALAFQSMRPLFSQYEPTNKNVPSNSKGVAKVTRLQSAFSENNSSPIGPAFISPGDTKVNQNPYGLLYTSTRQLLNEISIFSAIDCKVLIRGNPRLLNDVNITSDMFRGAETKTQTTTKNLTNHIGKVKIDILMPKDSIADADLVNPEVNFTEPFWFDGHYLIIGVENKFSEGDFTQELDLIGMVDEDTASVFFGKESDNKEQQKDTTGYQPGLKPLPGENPNDPNLYKPPGLEETQQQLNRPQPKFRQTPSGPQPEPLKLKIVSYANDTGKLI